MLDADNPLLRRPALPWIGAAPTATPAPATSDLVLFAGIYCRTWTIPDAGSVVPQHAHRHAHLTYLVAGAVQVVADGADLGTFTAPCAIKIAAEVKHAFLTLTSAVVLLCLHAIGEAEDVEVHAEHHLHDAEA